MRILLTVVFGATSLLGQAPANPELAAKTQAVNEARSALIAATYTVPASEAALTAKVDTLVAAEAALADARRGMPGPGGRGGGGRGGAPTYQTGGTIPRIQEAQVQALMQMTYAALPLVKAETSARNGLASTGATDRAAKVAAFQAAERALTKSRAKAFAKIQASPNKLAADQVAALVAMGGSLDRVTFTQPQPVNFAEHDGYVSLFDGVSLKNWDGNPKFWRAENGAIVGESTAQNPSGNTYLVYRGTEAKDFTLKLEIKVEGTGGTGIQYRSKTGIPWLAPIADNVTANNGPVNLNWMMTGPQADFWPVSRDWTGQFYSENTPMRILSWRGMVVEGAGLREKKQMGTIGDREALGKVVKMDDWNEYTIIARGGTFIQILNGQLMAVMVDDDPQSSNNQSGLIGIELEQVCKVSVRNIWLKKLN